MPFLQTNIQSVMEQINTLNIKYVKHHAWKSAVLLYFFAEHKGNSSTTQEHELESHLHKMFEDIHKFLEQVYLQRLAEQHVNITNSYSW